MGVLMQAFYQRGSEGVPLAPEGGLTNSWWEHLAGQAEAFGKSGFTAIWLPPVTKGASGTASIGYDVFDDYDIGSKHQKGTTATRYGTREQLLRCVAMMRANGLDVYADLVENQRAGGSGPGGFTFRYADADGTAGGGRFPKNPDDFHPNVPQDPDVPGPDFSFGSDLAPIRGGNPPGSLANRLIDSADWLTRSLDLQGYRVDDAKGQSSDFLLRLLNSKSMAGKFAVAEYFDGNVPKLQDWLFRLMKGRVAAFDFATRFTLANMCDSRPFNMAALDHTGLAGSNPFQAVTYILTSEGYPCVFYKDYSTDRFCFGLKPGIDRLIAIHERIADGATVQRFKDFDVFVYERTGGPHLLAGLNNDANAPRTVEVSTGFGADVALEDYAKHAPDIQTSEDGRVKLTIPRNLNGTGYVCYSRKGLSLVPQARSFGARQVFEGALDLDIPPATKGRVVQAARVFCTSGTRVSGTLTFDHHGLSAETTLTLSLLDPSGTALARRIFRRGDSGGGLDADVSAKGFHVFTLEAEATQGENPRPRFSLTVSYQGPKS
jgi:alpha-amylase